MLLVKQRSTNHQNSQIRYLDKPLMSLDLLLISLRENKRMKNYLLNEGHEWL
jgi:hypothetical protein